MIVLSHDGIARPTERRPRRRRPSPAAPRGRPHRRRRAVPAGPGPRARRGDAARRRVVHARRPVSSSRSSVPAAPARRRCWRRSPASPRPPRGRCASTASTCTPTCGPSAACSATCPRTTSSMPTCRSDARSATPRGCGSRRRPRAAEVDDAVRDAIDAVGLTEQADVRVGSLSGGQRKRASIAVELLTDPHVFFLDEPTSGLDPVTSAELIAHLRQLADRSATVVFTTHSVEDLAPVRSHRVHGARWASGLRRHRSTRRSSTSASARSPSSTADLGRPGRHDRRSPARPPPMPAPPTPRPGT